MMNIPTGYKDIVFWETYQPTFGTDTNTWRSPTMAGSVLQFSESRLKY